MKYNAKYDRWVSKDGLVYRYDEKNDRLVLCSRLVGNKGYSGVKCSKPCRKVFYTHRIVYETFVGNIPDKMEIDHINTIRDDNRVENLILVTRKQNCNNPLTKQHRTGVHRSSESKLRMSLAQKGKVAKNKGVATTDFGKKFIEHFGFVPSENKKLYYQEARKYHKNKGICSWEVEDK